VGKLALKALSPPEPLSPVSLFALVNDLGHTATLWRVYCSPLIDQPATFKSRLTAIDMRAAKSNLWSDPALRFDLGDAGHVVHVSLLLRLISLYESADSLQQACQPATDYLESCVRLCHNGGINNVSFATCAELIERASCYSLILLSRHHGMECWLPHSLAQLHLVGHDGTAPLGTAAMLKASAKLLSRTIEAALRLISVVLPSTGYRVHMHHGLAVLTIQARAALRGGSDMTLHRPDDRTPGIPHISHPACTMGPEIRPSTDQKSGKEPGPRLLDLHPGPLWWPGGPGRCPVQSGQELVRCHGNSFTAVGFSG
jgi:hypothetical protein